MVCCSMLSAYRRLGFFYRVKRSVGVYEISRFVNVEPGRFAGGFVFDRPDDPAQIFERSHENIRSMAFIIA